MTGDPSHALAGWTVVIPVLDEEPTIAGVIHQVRHAGVGSIVVVDSGSTDASAERAAAAGAVCVDARALGPGTDVLGKGDALWRSLPLVATPHVAFLDGDIFIDGPSFLQRLVAPIASGAAMFSKADFDRVRPGDGVVEPGRVTELVARPLLSEHFPELGRLHEPLSGQVAASVDLLMGLAFEPDYGLEAGMLIDVYRRSGIEAIAHPHCGTLSHVSQAAGPLEAMGEQVTRAILGRVHAEAGDVQPDPARARPPHAP